MKESIRESVFIICAVLLGLLIIMSTSYTFVGMYESFVNKNKLNRLNIQKQEWYFEQQKQKTQKCIDENFKRRIENENIKGKL